uniref:Uncharacterized protein n=1 Tax=Heterorhabditis bacteriophora TaxID=37862 RepID=A0A1I7W6I0_HETBA
MAIELSIADYFQRHTHLGVEFGGLELHNALQRRGLHADDTINNMLIIGVIYRKTAPAAADYSFVPQSTYSLVILTWITNIRMSCPPFIDIRINEIRKYGFRSNYVSADQDPEDIQHPDREELVNRGKRLTIAEKLDIDLNDQQSEEAVVVPAITPNITKKR